MYGGFSLSFVHIRKCYSLASQFSESPASQESIQPCSSTLVPTRLRTAPTPAHPVPLPQLTQQLVEVVADDVPHLAGLLAGQADQVALAGDDGDLVDGVQDQVEDALLLTQVLAVPQRAQLDLTLLVLWGVVVELVFRV